MSRNEWISIMVTLLTTGTAYFLSGPKIATLCIVAGLIIFVILHFTKKVQEKPVPPSTQTSMGNNSPNTNIAGNNNVVTLNASDPVMHQKIDVLTDLIKAQGGEDALLKRYPLGYVVFNLDYVTNAVTPFEARAGLGNFQYDFRPVRVLQNTDQRIAIQLPDLLKDGKLMLSGCNTGGIKRVGNLGGYGARSSDGFGVMVLGEILGINGSEITFLVGFQRPPVLPKRS